MPTYNTVTCDANANSFSIRGFLDNELNARFNVDHVDLKENTTDAVAVAFPFTHVVKEIVKQEPPKPKKIYQRGNATIVEWNDNTKTVVVKEDDCQESLYHAFCAAFAKKMLGSTGNVMKLIDKYDEKKINERKAKLAAIAEKEAQKLKREREEAEFKQAVKERIFEMKVSDAASKALYSKKLDKALNQLFESLCSNGSGTGEA